MRFEQTQHNETISPAAHASGKMIAEVHQYKTCTNAFDNIGQVADFGKGVLVGAADGGVAFIEFVANPDSMHQICKSAGEAIGTAAQYYSNKIGGGRVADIGKDAGNAANSAGRWLTEYGMKEPYERGKITGRAAADMLVAEAGLEVVKSVCTGAKVAEATEIASGEERLYATSSRDEFRMYFEELDDKGKEAFKAFDKNPPSKRFTGLVDHLMDVLPDSLKQFLEEKNVRIVPLKNLGQFGAGQQHFDGMFTVTPKGPYIFLSEELHEVMSGVINFRKLELSLRHEIVHAIDRLTEAKGWVSDSAAIKRVFEHDFDALTGPQQELLLERVGQGSMDRLRREIVAECVSRVVVPGADAVDHIFRGSFPNLDRMLQHAALPFMH
jgi:hypothetical protein